MLICFAGFVALAIGLQMFLPLPGPEGIVKVEVRRGMTFRQAAEAIRSKGLVRDANTLVALGRFSGLHTKLLPGLYIFRTPTSPWKIFKTLQRGEIELVRITVVEGEDLAQIKLKLSGSGLVKASEFEILSKDPSFLEEHGIQAPSIEGYLFPDTYIISTGLEPHRVLGIMIDRMWEMFDEGMRARASEMNMSANETLALASIIEKEARVESERAIISAVYHNRLKKGIRLQADPTAIYGVKPMGQRVLYEDLRRESPYNTYIIKGLPPGPIASPGISSIKAALYPADAPYIYFVSNNDGTHKFSVTMAEHEEAVKSFKIKRSIIKSKNGGKNDNQTKKDTGR